jgi:adenosylmethionine-8-amino-7-oxononanoate aminotransferase
MAFLMKMEMDREYLEIVKGEGIYVFDNNNNKYIDAISGVGVTCLGYGNEELSETLREQAMTIPFVHGMRFDNTPLKCLAKKLAEVAPFGLNCSFFCSGGSEANEGAYKLARQYHLETGNPNKHKIIGRTMSFHGNTLYNLSAGCHPLRRARHLPMLIELPHASHVNCYRCPYSLAYPQCNLQCAESLEELILAEDPSTIAAFVMEPIVGAALGCPVPPKGYAKRIREICDKYNILLIADEVMTGFGRTGKWFGMEHEDVAPDIITFAKGISAGYAPLGGMLFNEKIKDAFLEGSKYYEHNFTYAGNPLCAAVGVKVIEILQRDKYIEQVAKKSEFLFSSLIKELGELPCVGDIRGRGFFVGVELVRNKESKQPFMASEQGKRVLEAIALDERVVLYPCTGSAMNGLDGVHFILFPPFIMSEEEIQELVERLKRTCIRFQEKMGM